MIELGDVPDALLLVEPNSLRIVEVNGDVLGHRTIAIEGARLDTLLVGITPELLERARVGKHDPHPDSPLRLTAKHASGRVVPVDVKVGKARDGEHLVCSVRALSETARIAEREIVSVVCAVPTAIVTWKRDGTVVSWNPAAARLFGIDASIAIGKDIATLVRADDRAAFDAACASVWATGTPAHNEVLRAGADGDVEVEESLFLIRDVAWQPVRLGASYRDLTDVARLRRAAEALSSTSSPKSARTSKSTAMHDVAERAAADARATILLLGETGVGKSHLARHIHASSPRKQKPFLEVNCAGLDAQLAESELFGHERGSFTGAVTQKRGLVEAADGGTLLLDEVAELPLVVQAKLLTFLDDGAFRRVGSVKRLTADVRIIAATNVDLERAVVDGRFRRDLFFRLRVFPIVLPPLRERRFEIADIADALVDELCRRRAQPVPALSGRAKNALAKYAWPGNFRELKNALERALVVASGGRVVDVEHLPAEIGAHAQGPSTKENAARAPSTRLDDVVRAHIKRVLDEVDGNRTRAAELLGIDRTTLRRKLSSIVDGAVETLDDDDVNAIARSAG